MAVNCNPNCNPPISSGLPVPVPQRRSDAHDVAVGIGQPRLAHTPWAVLGDRARGDGAVHVLDVEVDMALRAAIEPVLGQMQLGGPRRSDS